MNKQTRQLIAEGRQHAKWCESVWNLVSEQVLGRWTIGVREDLLDFFAAIEDCRNERDLANLQGTAKNLAAQLPRALKEALKETNFKVDYLLAAGLRTPANQGDYNMLLEAAVAIQKTQQRSAILRYIRRLVEIPLGNTSLQTLLRRDVTFRNKFQRVMTSYKFLVWYHTKGSRDVYDALYHFQSGTVYTHWARAQSVLKGSMGKKADILFHLINMLNSGAKHAEPSIRLLRGEFGKNMSGPDRALLIAHLQVIADQSDTLARELKAKV